MRKYFVENQYVYTSEALASAVSHLTKYSWFAKGDPKGETHPVYDFIVSERFMLVDIHCVKSPGVEITLTYKARPITLGGVSMKSTFRNWQDLAVKDRTIFHNFCFGGFHPASNEIADALELINEWETVESKDRGKGRFQRHQTMHSAIETLINEKDHIRGRQYSSPVYATASLSAISGMTKLFGSSIRHQHFIRLRIARTTRYEEAGQSRHGSANQTLVEVSMSYDQFARFVASVGRGEGTPCTISWFGALMDEPEYINPVAMTHEQFAERLGERLEDAKKLAAKLKAMADGTNIKKGDVKDCAQKAGFVAEGLATNMEFYLEQFVEAMEKVVVQAQTEVETFARLNGVERPEMLALEGGGTLIIEASRANAGRVSAERIIPLEGPCDPCERTSPECDGCGHKEVKPASVSGMIDACELCENYNDGKGTVLGCAGCEHIMVDE